ncbi:hypothetical protein PHYC_01707 [Phycisphaerales bacterium]|nr:hypothetical protein PHYC_01707 [Phycisphaerales bacterium]
MKALVLVAGLALTGAASAQVWIEVPDAPAPAIPAPAPQFTVGVGPLLTIIGGGDFPGDNVDGYCIMITDPLAFSATTVGGTGQDTQLFLFDFGGMGVTFNDDSAFTLQSTVTGAFVPGPGLYALVVSTFDGDPLDAAGSEIWLDTPFGVERAPDGPGAPGPVSGWTGSPDLLPYSIFLTGATYCVPAPGAFALLGLGGLVAMRRRR